VKRDRESNSRTGAAHKAPLWRLGELGERVAAALAAGDGIEPPNGRVREVPDLRAIRYYTTLGMIDRPAEMRGRTAFYGIRHLRQLVAIKRLQATGLSLASIQQRLAGIDDKALAVLARVPDEIETGTSSSTATETEAPSHGEDRRRNFWMSTLGTESASQPPFAATPEIPPAAGVPPVAHPHETAHAPLQTLGLCDDVVLVIAGVRPLDAADMAALRAAAAPLVEKLQQLELIESTTERGRL
jgi:DNA-binding transcriptional MerR regulator